MKTETLSEIKKHVKHLNLAELQEICLKLAKFKSENKEYLNYLLFEASNPEEYAESVKISLQGELGRLSHNPYNRIRELRKLLGTLRKHIKFIGIKTVEIELLLWFTEQVIIGGQVRYSQKTTYNLLMRQLLNAQKLIAGLHEDLQFDYQQQWNEVLEQAHTHVKGFRPRELGLVTIGI